MTALSTNVPRLQPAFPPAAEQREVLLMATGRKEFLTYMMHLGEISLTDAAPMTIQAGMKGYDQYCP